MADVLDDAIQKATGCSRLQCLGDVKGGIVNAGNAKIYEVDNRKIFVKFNMTPQLVRGPNDDGAILISEYLPNLQSIKDDNTWYELGKRMARLHNYNKVLLAHSGLSSSKVTCASSVPVSSFGYHKAHFFGPEFHVPADTWEDTWEEYLARHLFDRLIHECEAKFGERELGGHWAYLSRVIHKPFKDVDVKPALLHGDLFDINVGHVNGEPVVFDPQSWYGDIEFEQGTDFPPSYDSGYSSVIGAPPAGAEIRSEIYDLFVCILLYFCQVDADQNRKHALDLFTSINKKIV